MHREPATVTCAGATEGRRLSWSGTGGAAKALRMEQHAADMRGWVRAMYGLGPAWPTPLTNHGLSLAGVGAGDESKSQRSGPGHVDLRAGRGGHAIRHRPCASGVHGWHVPGARLPAGKTRPAPQFLLLASGHVGGLSTCYSLTRYAHPPTRERVVLSVRGLAKSQPRSALIAP